ncbi:GNAT family N-acetyltransferase [Wenzhouxiangella marina]|uniref:Phosphinothricin acetyltransferase n=1 Tax=Wenzhouxiangella marina TaxID=1579979 RepID=A0A0K0XV02_9GAMM|nr:GNAT family N-acetyltransferase [Wenzhouxiangella marina]AKS41539.1 phosphinothricin acetyltransferase [Wenzhouxiangella marina]MBB6086702.1 phosphinothricin acetyltransferase [Wenzhouxiangella marina]
MTAAESPIIRAAEPEDSSAIATLYNRYVLESTATFELSPVDAATIAERMAGSPPGLRWLVVESTSKRIAGYASVAPWKPRGAYARTVETSVYLDTEHQGRGFGKAVYGQLLDNIWSQGYHAALAGIALPNAASIGLHERLGFRPAGVLREVGFKFGRWIDIGYWQALEPGLGSSG